MPYVYENLFLFISFANDVTQETSFWSIHFIYK